MEAPRSTSSKPKTAKIEQVPDAKIFSIEFPGHVDNLDKVKVALGGEQAIANAYLGGAPLDLRYRIRDPFAIPIHGQTISTPNFLLKVTRRYKVKRQPGSQRTLPPYRAPTEHDVPYNEKEEPQYEFEMVGTIPKTTRFTGLADYQHIVDPNDPIVLIKSDLHNIEYENLISMKVDNTDPEEDPSSLQLIPPVVIAKSIVPHPFKYKARDREDVPKNKPGRPPKIKSGSKRKADDGSTVIDVESDDSYVDDI